MTALPIFQLEALFSEWEFKARHHLTASDAESMTLPELLDMASPEDRRAFEDLWLGYTETWGAADVRAAIAALYEGRSADDILCFAGAEEGIYAAMQTLLGPQDHVIVVTPCYQSLETVALAICHVTGVPLDPEDGWSLDIDRVAAAIQPNTRMVVMNFPHNPTGAVLSDDRFEALIALCRRHGLFLFSDEAYRPLGPEGGRQLPAAADVYERALSLSVLSKAYGLPGLRVGWIACQDHDVLARLEKTKHYLSICNSGPSERLALIALKAADRLLSRNRSLVSANLARLDAFFDGYPHLFEWRRPDGGCVAFPRYLGPEGVETFTSALLEKTGVLLLPASVYRSQLGPTPTDRFRIGAGRRNLDAGLEAMRPFLAPAGAAG